MSDLSQLYINQQNKVSLYIDDNIKLNNVYLPRSFNNLIDNIIIMGGEPLDQDKNELPLFLEDIQKLNKIIK